MEQRDYIQRQIEMIGIVLRALLGYILRIGTGGGSESDVSYVSRSLKEELDIDLEGLLSMTAAETIGILESKGFDRECMLGFRDMLVSLASRLPAGDIRRQGIHNLCKDFETEIGKRSGIADFADFV